MRAREATLVGSRVHAGLRGLGSLAVLLLCQTVSPDAARAAVSFLPPVNLIKAGAFAGLAEDFDGDGKIDLHVGGDAGPSIYYGNGDGTFGERLDFPDIAPVTGFVTADLNGDGRRDLVVGSPHHAQFEVRLNRGARAYAPPVTYALPSRSGGLTLNDFNGDGRPDLAVANHEAHSLSVFINRGDGTFLAPVTYGGGNFPGGITSADLNGDGKIDLAMANIVSGNVAVYLGDGTGRFSRVGTYGAGQEAGGVVADDFDGDGKMDLAVANWGADSVSILFGEGGGAFRPAVFYPAGPSPAALYSADMDGDGDADLVFGNGDTNYFSVLENRGNGTFAAVVHFSSAGQDRRSLALGDFNGDGLPDVALGGRGDLPPGQEPSSLVAIFINTTAQPTPALRSLTVSAASVVGGCGAVSGTVTLTAPAPAGGIVVSLSDNLPALILPPSLTIPEGAVSATFTAALVPVSALQTGTVFASYRGSGRRVALAVRPTGITRVTVSPSELLGGRAATGQVEIDCAAPAGGLVLALSSSQPAVTLPTSVTVPAGATSVTFPVTTRPVTAPTSVTVAAAYAAMSQATTLTLLPDPPSAPPSSLTATGVAPTEIRLSWRDNSGNETGFEIERRTPSEPFRRVATVAADATAYTDPGLNPSTTYTYRVRAINASGASAYSNEASGTTLPEPPPPPPMRRITVFRPSTREWFLREMDGSATVAQFGGPGDLPVAGDYLGTGTAQIAVFRPLSREWFIRRSAGFTVPVSFPASGDTPVPADYRGVGRTQIAVYREGGDWSLRNDNGTATLIQFGGPGDVPVPADYFGLGHAQIAVYRPATGEWFLRSETGGTVTVPWGQRSARGGDVPLPGDYLGLGRAQIAVYRPSTSEFYLRDDLGRATRIPFGVAGDMPVPADYQGIRRLQLAVYRPATGEWFVRADSGATTRVVWGGIGDIPVPAAFALRFER